MNMFIKLLLFVSRAMSVVRIQYANGVSIRSPKHV